MRIGVVQGRVQCPDGERGSRAEQADPEGFEARRDSTRTSTSMGFLMTARGTFTMTPEWVPFWSVYWRTLLGLHWDWRYHCVPADGRREVACEHDFPRLNLRDDHGIFVGRRF